MSIPSASPKEGDSHAAAAGKSSGEQQQEQPRPQKLSSEEIMIQTAYNDTKKVLQAPSGVLDTVSSMVTLRNAVEDPPLTDGDVSYSTMQYSSNNVSLLTPNRGHHAIVRALEKFEHLEKDEAELQLKTPLTTELTKIATGDHYDSPRDAVATLEALSQSVPRRVLLFLSPAIAPNIEWPCHSRPYSYRLIRYCCKRLPEQDGPCRVFLF